LESLSDLGLDGISVPPNLEKGTLCGDAESAIAACEGKFSGDDKKADREGCVKKVNDGKNPFGKEAPCSSTLRSADSRAKRIIEVFKKPGEAGTTNVDK
jgi:hypothetical protein